MSNSSRRSDDQVYRVVVVDDHEMILESIVRLLAADPRINIVGTALTGIEGIAISRLTYWSLITTFRTWTLPKR